MLIEEQIKIARMIASGTPREVAIQEQFRGPMSADADRSGAIEAEVVKKKIKPAKQQKPSGKVVDKPNPQQIAKERVAIQKEKQQKIKSQLKQDKNREKELKIRKKITKLKRDSVVRSGLADRVKKAKFSTANTTQVTTAGDQGATAVQQATGNLAKAGVATTKNVAKGTAKAARLGAKGVRGVGRLIGKLSSRRKELRNEEFIQEVEDKKDSKAKKVIDIMKGKNSVKINPDMKEDTVVIQDASGKDSVEIVDIISSQKIKSDWRKEINVTEASAAWQRKEGKSKSGGLNEKGRKSYERQNPGSDLKAPSKKVGNKRRASFCARMKGMKKKLTSKKTARDPDSRINKSLRAWNC